MAHILKKKNCSYNSISVHLIKLHFHIIKIYIILQQFTKLKTRPITTLNIDSQFKICDTNIQFIDYMFKPRMGAFFVLYNGHLEFVS